MKVKVSSIKVNEDKTMSLGVEIRVPSLLGDIKNISGILGKTIDFGDVELKEFFDLNHNVEEDFLG